VLGEKLHVSATLFRSVLIPGWGQIFAEKPVRGVVCLSAFVGTAGLTIYGYGSAAKANQEYKDFVSKRNTVSGMQELRNEFLAQNNGVFDQEKFNSFWTGKENALFDTHEKRLTRAYIFTGITAGVWALNLIDASIAGVQMRNRIKLYFSAIPGQQANGGIAIAL
jgi:hypothetical protein